MDNATAAFWLDTLAAAMAALWLAGAWFTWRTRDVLRRPLQGAEDISLPAATAVATIARRLAEGRAGQMLHSATIEPVANDELKWHSDVMPRHSGRLRATGDARRCRVEWDLLAGGGLTKGAVAMVVAGAAVVVGLYLLLHTVALPAESPAARGQVVQMVQAVHLLWPPWLFAGLARTLRKRLGAEVRRTVQNVANVPPAP